MRRDEQVHPSVIRHTQPNVVKGGWGPCKLRPFSNQSTVRFCSAPEEHGRASALEHHTQLHIMMVGWMGHSSSPFLTCWDMDKMVSNWQHAGKGRDILRFEVDRPSKWNDYMVPSMSQAHDAMWICRNSLYTDSWNTSLKKIWEHELKSGWRFNGWHAHVT